MNITDFFWSSHEHCWRRDFTCSHKNTVKTSKLTPVTFFFHDYRRYFSIFHLFCGIKRKYNFRKNHSFRIFQNNPSKVILKFSISRLFSINNEKNTAFLAVFMVFAGLLLASNVQRWIRDVQKCSSLNQLWPEMSKLKSPGTALNIAENAEISESALKIPEYLWELNPGYTLHWILSRMHEHWTLRETKTQLCFFSQDFRIHKN